MKDSRGRKATHGMSKSPEYTAWLMIRNACYQRASQRYRYYGARGIRVCDRWSASFAHFLEDVGKRPDASYRFARANKDGDFEPGNASWMQDHGTQGKGSRKKVLGRRACDVARDAGVPIDRLLTRLDAGCTDEEAVRLAGMRGAHRGGYVVTIGDRVQTLTQWCRELNVSYHSVVQRIHKLGWDAESALTVPIRKQRKGVPRESAGRRLRAQGDSCTE